MKTNLIEMLDEATHADWAGGAPAVELGFARELVEEVLRLRSLSNYEPLIRGRMIDEVLRHLSLTLATGTFEGIQSGIEDFKETYATDIPQAWLDVIGERRHQINDLGFSSQQDDGYVFDELTRAARAYIMVSNPGEDQPSYWPWDRKFWNPKDRRENLVRAAALLIAEVERIDRK
jgi:hypothetical protein